MSSRSKYNAVKTTVDGIQFDSKREAARYQELRLLEKAQEISDLKTQVPFLLIPKCGKNRAIYYYADFTYFDSRTGDDVVEDCKGCRTEVYRLKKKLMKWLHWIDIKET